MELKIIIRYINKKRTFLHHFFFTTLTENCVGREYYDIIDSDKIQMTNKVQVELLELINSLITK